MAASALVLSAALTLIAVGFCGCNKKATENTVQTPPESQATTSEPAGTVKVSASEKALADAKAVSLPVLLNFHSTKCTPCIEIEKVIKEVEPEYAGQVAFVIVDVYDATEQNLCNQYGIQTIPTTVFLDASGQPVDVYSGVIDADSMRGILDGLISGKP